MSTSSNNNLLFIIVVTLTEGKRHDAGMLRMSGLLDQLQQFSHSPAGQPLCIYGDPAYPLRIHLQAPYKAAHTGKKVKFQCGKSLEYSQFNIPCLGYQW